MISHKAQTVDKALTFGFGGMSRKELEYLYDYCKNKKVLELGSHIGQSSYVIASVAKSLTCVDAWIDFCPYLERRQAEIYAFQNPSMEESFNTNTKGLGIKKIKAFTAHAASIVDNDYDLVLIDADHSYTGVKQDISLYKDKGKYLMFHDYNSSWEGVKRAVDESGLISQELVGFLLLTKVKNERDV
jgi:hypothetical protein